jgi:hypothetical protein
MLIFALVHVLTLFEFYMYCQFDLFQKLALPEAT